MKQKYAVTFVQYHIYEVEANDENEAEDLAQEIFYSDMRQPIAACWHDDVMIEQCGGSNEQN